MPGRDVLRFQECETQGFIQLSGQVRHISDALSEFVFLPF